MQSIAAPAKDMHAPLPQLLERVELVVGNRRCGAAGSRVEFLLAARPHMLGTPLIAPRDQAKRSMRRKIRGWILRRNEQVGSRKAGTNKKPRCVLRDEFFA